MNENAKVAFSCYLRFLWCIMNGKHTHKMTLKIFFERLYTINNEMLNFQSLLAVSSDFLFDFIVKEFGFMLMLRCKLE